MAMFSPRYIVRIVQYQDDHIYALQFELDERTNDPRAPIPNNMKNVSIGYNRQESEFVIVKDPLDRGMAARVIHQFTTTIAYQDVPVLRLRVDPTEEYAAYSYNKLYRECERGGVLGNVFLRALMSAYGETGGGRTTSQGLLGCGLDILSRHSQILPAGELQWASYMLISRR